MLVLSRRAGQAILIGPDIEIVVVSTDGAQVRLGINAPREITVLRRELLEQVQTENRLAATSNVNLNLSDLFRPVDDRPPGVDHE